MLRFMASTYVNRVSLGCELSKWAGIIFFCVIWSCLLFVVPSTAQTIIGSARLVCGTGPAYKTGGPIVGAILNRTNTTITDLEIELSIITRDKKGTLKRLRDARFVVVPSLNQSGMVTKMEPNSDAYFSIPGEELRITGGGMTGREDFTCGHPYDSDANQILNVAAIAITRVNGKSLLTGGNRGKQLKQAPLESMLQVPRYLPDHVPTQGEVIQGIREQNALLHSTIINKQLQDCLSRGTWACSFNNDTNINVVITQQ
jgi:hypothetical protein